MYERNILWDPYEILQILEKYVIINNVSNDEFKVDEDLDSDGVDNAYENRDFLPDDVEEAVHEEIVRAERKSSTLN